MPTVTNPNILYVFADQWPAHVAGYAGNPDVQTPRIDAFAAESVNCRYAMANTPVCTPSRATLMTGLLPDRHGLFLNDAPLDPTLVSLGKHFAAAGYDTAYIGKWHMDGHGRSAFIPPDRQHGFGYWKALECTHDYNASRYYENGDPTPRTWPDYDAIAQTDDAISYLTERSRDRPFFMMMSWGPPHNPYHTAPERYKALYDPATLNVRPNVPEDHREATRRTLGGFYAHCSALDACFGRLLDALEELGLAGETIVVFTSDHGDHLGSHYLAEKQSPLEESLRVPFLVRWPGRLPVSVNDTVVSVLDVFPTLCGLSGTACPEGLQGRDFSRELAAGTAPPASDNFGFCAGYHLFGTWPHQHRNKPVPKHLHAREYRGIRTTRYTYCEDLNGPWLLFDNATDPCQLNNLIGNPAFEEHQKELAERLRSRMIEYGDAFSPGMEYVNQWGYDVDASGTIRVR